MERPILQLEINEIPWRFLNEFRGKPEYPSLEKFFRKARLYTSQTVDPGELSPWVIWPTIHRGVPSGKHRIRNLGQNPASFQGTAIWEELRKKGKTIGIFGALQSWPPLDPGKDGFFVPDTFSHDERCIPAYLEPLQRFNLDQVSKNGRVVRSTSFLSSLNIPLLRSIWKSGIRISTLMRVCFHLVAEKFDPRLRARRSIYQNILFWDVFKAHYDYRNPPLYSSYFTNHVASAMHRYWNYLFPSDYPLDRRPADSYHRSTIEFAVKIMDEMLGEVLGWMEENPNLTVLVITGMGQDTIIRERHHGKELTVIDSEKLMQAMGIPKDQFRALLAMAPQTAVDIPDAKWRAKAKSEILKLRCPSGQQPFLIEEVGVSLSITLANPSRPDCDAGEFIHDDKKISFFDLGVKCWEIDAGTAYHIPEGIFAIAGPGSLIFSEHWKEPTIPGDKIKAELLHVLGVDSAETTQTTEAKN